MTVLSRAVPPKNFLARLVYFTILLFVILFLTLLSMRLFTLARSVYLRNDSSSESTLPMSIRESYPFIAFPTTDQWLWNHFEPGQSIAQYKRHLASHPLPGDAKIYLMKLTGEQHINEGLFELTREYLELYFCMPGQSFSLDRTLTLPEDAIRKHPETGIQIDAQYLLHHILVPSRPNDAAGLLALTANDLWPGNDWSFVFGKASRTERVGVWSIARLNDAANQKVPSKTLLRRTLKTASHEFGHMLGMRHCISYQCNMNGSNHLEEADSQPLTLCPHCLQKLLLHNQCDLEKRLNNLHAFLDKHGLEGDSQKRLKIIIDSLSSNVNND